MVRALAARPKRAPVYMVLDSQSGAWGSAVLALMARVAGAPLIVHHHVFSYFDRGSTAAGVFFKLAGRKALHLTLCDCMKARLQARYGADRQALVLSNPAFVDVAVGSRQRERLLRVGFLGNVTRDKGVGLFMQTIRRLAASGVELEAHIAGPIRDTELAREIADFVAEAPGSRNAPGGVYGPAKQAFLESLDVLLFPSQYVNEAQPVTIYEALAVGAPVLATARGCIPEQLPDEWVFDEANFVDGASAVLAQWARSPDDFAQGAERAASEWDLRLTQSQRELQSCLEAVERLAASA